MSKRRKTLSIVLDQETIERLNKYVENGVHNRSRLIERLIVDFLNKVEDKNESKEGKK